MLSGILFREFDYKKAGIILDSLHFSAWVLLGHIRLRQQTLLKFMKVPEHNSNVWFDAPQPENHVPQTKQEWFQAIDAFEEN